MKWLPLTFSSVLFGCALTTAGPGGPLRSGTSTQIQFTSAVAYGPATATVGGVQVSGNAQSNQLGGKSVVDPLPNPVPVTIAVRQQVGPSFEVAGDLGWVDSGVGLRLRLPSSESLPLVLSAGARTGEIGIFGRDTYQGALALEAYPALSRSREGLNAHRLVLSLGLAAGAFEHDLSLPESFESGSDAPHGFPSEIVIRREVRLQAAVGVHLQGQHGAIMFALQPWVVLASAAAVSATCDQCEGPSSLSAFSQSWGLSLLVMPALTL
ncbi:MAG TPA: hypothetical protein VH853_00510 [Polyangia bacterium]|jgi:hypothetical protein|nr:hypothetical protein [Polyangia bacterium]